MPNCFYTIHGCCDWGGMDSSTGQPKGRLLSAKAYKTHQLSEKTKMYNEAQQEADAVVERQVEEIAKFIAATTLADGISGTSDCPGGHMWATNNEGTHPGTHPTRFESQPPSHNPQPQAGSRCSREASILLSLADLEASIQDLFNDSNPRFDALSLLFANNQPASFPLSDLMTRSSNLRTELDNITNKALTVALPKEAILKKLDDLDKRLSYARKKWLQALSAVQEEQTLTHGTIFDSMCINTIISHTDNQIFFFSSPLQSRSRKCQSSPPSRLLHDPHLSSHSRCQPSGVQFPTQYVAICHSPHPYSTWPIALVAQSEADVRYTARFPFGRTTFSP